MDHAIGGMRRRTVSLAIVPLAFLIYLFFSGSPTDRPVVVDPQSAPSSTQSQEETSAVIETNASVVRVVDGDTIVVRMDGQSQDVTVRLLGVNTPETVDPRRPVQCFGVEASSFMHAILDGRRVRLEGDPEADEYDKYGRLLRNVIGENGMDVNARLVQDGYAYAYINFPQNKRRKTELRHLEEEAREAKRGLWDPETCPT